MTDILTHGYLSERHRQPVVEWLLSKGFIIYGENNDTLGIAWSDRAGMDFTDLEFYPLARHAEDTGWSAIIGHHTNGENPRLELGVCVCETLEDVQMIYQAIRLTNGYKRPDPELAAGPPERRQP